MAVVVQSENQRKFDRQTRLWGQHGQQLIQDARILCLGSGPAASETLKNLVLPNVGSFTILDDAIVAAPDLGENFFVTVDDVGQNRAETVTKWLVEMNPDVQGTSINRNVYEVLDSVPDGCGDVFDGYQLIIVTEVYGTERLQKLGAFCRQKNTPLMVIRTNGLIGYIRLDYDEIDIMESHPSNDRTDLYLYQDQLNNFPELREYCDSYDLKTEDIEKKAHLPCVAMLAQYAQQWVQEKGQLPQGFREQQEFKDSLVEKFGEGENVENAVHWAYQVYSPPRIDREVREVLEHPNGEEANLNNESKFYWFCVRGLRDFMENEGNGFLPVSTNIPDMHTDSDSYVNLKRIVKERYEKDRAALGGHIRRRLEQHGRNPDELSDELLDRFVKNVRSLRVVKVRAFDQEFNSPDMEYIGEQYMDWAMLEEGKADDAEEKPFTPKEINWYWAFRALDAYYEKNKKIAGNYLEELTEAQLDEIAAALGAEQQAIFSQIELEQEVVPQCLRELVRFGGSQPHNTAAVLGGIASQAALKIILKQFYTFNSTFIWNGIYCTGTVFSV